MSETVQPGTLLRRYLAGEHEAVWAELTALGPSVRERRYFDDAWGVARETMRRARRNVELIIPRLDRLGYRFWDGMTAASRGTPAMAIGGKSMPIVDLSSNGIADLVMKQYMEIPAHMRENIDNRLRERLSEGLSQLLPFMKEQATATATKSKKKAEQARKRAAITDNLKNPLVFAPATKDDAAFFREVEEKGMILPLSVRAWFEEVGDVNLVGTHPALSPGGVDADPLTIFSDSMMNEIDTWLESYEASEDSNMHEAVLSWNARDKAQQLAHKTEFYDYGYIIELPNAAADAVLECESHGTTFVGYLRIAFRWGGFPGWEQEEKRPEEELKFLTEGLQPI